MSPRAVDAPDRCAFRQPSEEHSDAPISSGAIADAKPTDGLTSVPRTAWITIFGLFLMLLIAAYLGVVAGGILYLLGIEGAIVKELWPIHGMWFIKLNAAFVVLFPLTRLSLHLWNGIRGLVTQQYDDAPEASVGILLERDSHPELYRAVAEVGDVVKSPTPDEIRVTYRPNCYAVEQRSFALRTDRRLVLVIGLPQLEVLTLSELKVIVAHELAHFGGGDTRLAVFVFRFLETLRAASEENAGTGWRWVDPVAWLSWVYFHLFLVLSAPIRRHQELRADGWSASAYGGPFAAQTLLRDWLLERRFDETLERYWEEGPPPGAARQNLFREFSARFHDLTPEGQDYLEQRLSQEEKPSFWDSHPTIRERMANMRRYRSRTLPEPLPAYLLVRDVEAVEERLQAQLAAQRPAFPPSY